MKRAYRRRRRILAFTLIEMLVVITIIALLASLALPGFQAAILRARSVQCKGNLRAIGMAATQAATDNNNQYPEIDQTADGATPIYSPPGPSILTALGPYGITTNSIQCPVDMSTSPSAFQLYHSSYEWDPVFDNEPLNETVIYSAPTLAGNHLTIPVNSSRVRLAMDFNRVHSGHCNVVYGDGHVATH